MRSSQAARERLASILQRLAADPPELASVFTEVFTDDVSADLDRIAHLADENSVSPISGAIVSIKDLVDVRGHPTRAGSRILENRPAASQDAEVVRRLRQAGTVILGHTNMTELAYSGLGLNPHHGTPDNPIKPGHIPGGSTSGGAVSVATGIADFAVGSDTGGSLRIPAAFTGTVGFKPTQNSVSQQGCLPLSQSLDTIGPLAREVAVCEAAWRVMSGTAHVAPKSPGGKLIIPTNFGMDGLDDAIAAGFEALARALSRAGFPVEEKSLPVLDDYRALPVWHFAAIECQAFYRDDYLANPELFDPRVLQRMHRANEVSAVEYRRTLNERNRLIELFAREIGDDYLLMPTVAMLPPAFTDFGTDEDYDRLNLLALRNTTLANVLDGCSLSIPFRYEEDMMGAMLTASGGRDDELLAMGQMLEKAVQADFPQTE